MLSTVVSCSTLNLSFHKWYTFKEIQLFWHWNTKFCEKIPKLEHHETRKWCVDSQFASRCPLFLEFQSFNKESFLAPKTIILAGEIPKEGVNYLLIILPDKLDLLKNKKKVYTQFGRDWTKTVTAIECAHIESKNPENPVLGNRIFCLLRSGLWVCCDVAFPIANFS